MQEINNPSALNSQGQNYNELPPLEVLKRLYRYDSSTGDLIRKVNQGPARANTPAGCAVGRPGSKYLKVIISGKGYYVHRVIWALVHGGIPTDMQIDHIDGNGLNNAIHNLRLVNSALNSRNKALRKSNSTTGVPGVYFCTIGYRVHIRRVFLGFFKSFDEACAWRKLAERFDGYHENNGRAA